MTNFEFNKTISIIEESQNIEDYKNIKEKLSLKANETVIYSEFQDSVKFYFIDYVGFLGSAFLHKITCNWHIKSKFNVKSYMLSKIRINRVSFCEKEPHNQSTNQLDLKGKFQVEIENEKFFTGNNHMLISEMSKKLISPGFTLDSIFLSGLKTLNSAWSAFKILFNCGYLKRKNGFVLCSTKWHSESIYYRRLEKKLFKIYFSIEIKEECIERLINKIIKKIPKIQESEKNTLLNLKMLKIYANVTDPWALYFNFVFFINRLDTFELFLVNGVGYLVNTKKVLLFKRAVDVNLQNNFNSNSQLTKVPILIKGNWLIGLEYLPDFPNFFSKYLNLSSNPEIASQMDQGFRAWLEKEDNLYKIISINLEGRGEEYEEHLFSPVSRCVNQFDTEYFSLLKCCTQTQKTYENTLTFDGLLTELQKRNITIIEDFVESKNKQYIEFYRQNKEEYLYMEVEIDKKVYNGRNKNNTYFTISGEFLFLDIKEIARGFRLKPLIRKVLSKYRTYDERDKIIDKFNSYKKEPFIPIETFYESSMDLPTPLWISEDLQDSIIFGSAAELESFYEKYGLVISQSKLKNEDGSSNNSLNNIEFFYKGKVFRRANSYLNEGFSSLTSSYLLKTSNDESSEPLVITNHSYSHKNKRRRKQRKRIVANWSIRTFNSSEEYIPRFDRLPKYLVEKKLLSEYANDLSKGPGIYLGFHSFYFHLVTSDLRNDSKIDPRFETNPDLTKNYFLLNLPYFEHQYKLFWNTTDFYYECLLAPIEQLLEFLVSNGAKLAVANLEILDNIERNKHLFYPIDLAMFNLTIVFEGEMKKLVADLKTCDCVFKCKAFIDQLCSFYCCEDEEVLFATFGDIPTAEKMVHPALMLGLILTRLSIVLEPLLPLLAEFIFKEVDGLFQKGLRRVFNLLSGEKASTFENSFPGKSLFVAYLAFPENKTFVTKRNTHKNKCFVNSNGVLERMKSADFFVYQVLENLVRLGKVEREGLGLEEGDIVRRMVVCVREDIDLEYLLTEGSEELAWAKKMVGVKEIILTQENEGMFKSDYEALLLEGNEEGDYEYIEYGRNISEEIKKILSSSKESFYFCKKPPVCAIKSYVCFDKESFLKRTVQTNMELEIEKLWFIKDNDYKVYYIEKETQRKKYVPGSDVCCVFISND